MRFIKNIAAAFSMFSAIPVPHFELNEKDTGYFLCAFPLVGLIQGLVCAAFCYLSTVAGFPDVVRAAFFTVIPVVMTGGIHHEGFADTMDAVSSRGSFEKKHEIMKDPHTGAFAVIHLCVYFLWIFAMWMAIKEFRPLQVVMIFMLSRSLSGTAAVSFPVSEYGGMLRAFSENAEGTKVKPILIAADILLSVLLVLSGATGAAAAAAAYIIFGYYRHMSVKHFGGISGDPAGWFLLTAEKWMLTAIVIVQYLERIK